MNHEFILGIVHPWEDVAILFDQKIGREIDKSRKHLIISAEMRARIGAFRGRLRAYLDSNPNSNLGALTVRGEYDGLPPDLFSDLCGAIEEVSKSDEASRYYIKKGESIVVISSQHHSFLSLPHKGSIDVIFKHDDVQVIINGHFAGITNTPFYYSVGARYISINYTPRTPDCELVVIRPYAKHIIEFK